MHPCGVVCFVPGREWTSTQAGEPAQGPGTASPCLHVQDRFQELHVYIASHAINLFVLTRMKFNAKDTIEYFH